jgi:hypothetical protein
VSGAPSASAELSISSERVFQWIIGTDGLGGFIIKIAGDGISGLPPLTIATTGWYTFKHSFRDNGSDILTVDMSVLETAGTVLGNWTLSDDRDVINVTVGGNIYGWMMTNNFPEFAIDNISLTKLGTDKDCKHDGWRYLTKPDDTLFTDKAWCIWYANECK